uniref:EF-hand domain-containing protein n=1 Tax=Angiostrongylus cantonensis TaxID=6313 RepID=A0A0K0CXN7_ANGCA
MKLSRSELERLFLAGDVDRNSELDGEECIPMRKLLKSTLNEKAELLFEKYSTNGGRNLTLEEVSSLARNEFQVIPNDTQRIFTFSDQNNDHIIDAGEEMSNLLLKLRTQAIVNARRMLSVRKYTMNWGCGGGGTNV